MSDITKKKHSTLSAMSQVIHIKRFINRAVRQGAVGSMLLIASTPLVRPRSKTFSFPKGQAGCLI